MEQKAEKLTTREILLFTCAMIAFFSGIGFGVAGFIVAPTGELHDSVLWLIAQLLLFTASAFGLVSYTEASTRKMNEKFASFRKEVIRKISGRQAEPEEETYEEDYEDTDRQGARHPADR